MAQKMSVSNKRNVKTLSRKEKDERKQQVLKLYQEGLPPKAIAREMGRSMSLIYNIIAELKEEGKIVNEKPFENVEVRDAVIMYMINRKYTDREIGRLIDVCVNTIQNIKNKKERLTDEEINEIIKEKASEIEFANAMYIERKVDSNEKKLIELLQQNELNLKEIAEQLQMSMNEKLERLMPDSCANSTVVIWSNDSFSSSRTIASSIFRFVFNRLLLSVIC